MRKARSLRKRWAPSEEQVWALAAAGAAVLAAVLTRGALKSGWRSLLHEEPPLDPSRADVSWKTALLWSAAAGMMVGVARVVARRGASYGHRRWLERG